MLVRHRYRTHYMGLRMPIRKDHGRLAKEKG